MDQLQSIWAAARENIRPQMTGLSFHAWIDVIVPLVLQKDVLVLEVPTPDIQKTLEDFYFDHLRDAVKAANDIYAPASGEVTDLRSLKYCFL